MDQSQPATNRNDRTIAAALFAAAAAAYALLHHYLPNISPDGFLYLELAQNLPHHGYQIMGEPHTKFLPLYPVLMALINISSCKTIPADAAGFIISALAGAALAPLVYLTARELKASTAAALIAAAAQATLATGLDEYRDLSVMPLFTLLIAAAVLQLIRERKFTAGILIGLAMTTRFEAYLLVPFIILPDLKQPRRLAALAAGITITAAPWWVRNLLLYGQAVHTAYMVELFKFSFHLPQLSRDLALEFGPPLLILAAIGFPQINKTIRRSLLGFTVLYLILHVMWWYYEDRFLLPLAPLWFPVAAIGIDRVSQRFATRRRAALIGSALVLMAPIVTVAALAIHLAATEPPDPYQQAARSLAAEPPSLTILGSRRPLLHYYSDHPAANWEDQPDQDITIFVRDQIIHHHAAFLLWSSHKPSDLQRLPFLAPGKTVSQTVTTSNGPAVLTYQFLQTFRQGPVTVHLYRLQLQPAP